MRLGAYANNEAVSTGPRNVALLFKAFEFIVDHLMPAGNAVILVP
jgi:hypothetical protein